MSADRLVLSPYLQTLLWTHRSAHAAAAPLRADLLASFSETRKKEGSGIFIELSTSYLRARALTIITNLWN